MNAFFELNHQYVTTQVLTCSMGRYNVYNVSV